MIGVDQLLGFGLAALVLIVIPGPSVVFVVGRAVSYGQRIALASVIGNTTGLFLVMSLVAVGLGTIVAESIVVFTVIKLLGAAYLI
jgi:threonine/homoserine/homoserine lactone efflux protein